MSSRRGRTPKPTKGALDARFAAEERKRRPIEWIVGGIAFALYGGFYLFQEHAPKWSEERTAEDMKRLEAAQAEAKQVFENLGLDKPRSPATAFIDAWNADGVERLLALMAESDRARLKLELEAFRARQPKGQLPLLRPTKAALPTSGTRVVAYETYGTPPREVVVLWEVTDTARVIGLSLPQ